MFRLSFYLENTVNVNLIRNYSIIIRYTCTSSRSVLESSLEFETRFFFYNKLTKNALVGLMIFWLGLVQFDPTRISAIISGTCTLKNKYHDFDSAINFSVWQFMLVFGTFFLTNISISLILFFEQDRYLIMIRDELSILCGNSFKIYNVTYWNVWI